MNLPAELLAVVALLPAMTGPAPAAAPGDSVIVLALCSGGSLVLPPDGDRAPGPATQPCCAKGCHRDERRRRGPAGGQPGD